MKMRMDFTTSVMVKQLSDHNFDNIAQKNVKNIYAVNSCALKR